MSEHFCDRCGEYLPEGCIKYTVHVQIISDFDSVILLDEDEQGSDGQGFLSSVEDMDEKELEEEVYQEISFTLCVKCKKRFARDPFNRSAKMYRTSKNFERLFH